VTGVVIDLVATYRNRQNYMQEAYEESKWSDAIYHSYAGFVNGAKALLLAERKQITKQESSIYLIPFS
jgi:sulfite reductase (ferredoxin)